MNTATDDSAVFCRHCETIFPVEADDFVLDQVYCPTCVMRTRPEDRAVDVSMLQGQYPKAVLYAQPQMGFSVS